MAGVKIAILNQSNEVSTAEVEIVVRAVQAQIDEDFGPVWNVGATMEVVSEKPGPGEPHFLMILDDDTTGEFLGYHDCEVGTYLPFGFVHVKKAKSQKIPWSVTLSHEILEMLINPFYWRAQFCENGTKPYLIYYEVCDPCQSIEFAYDKIIDGEAVRVSDFVFPEWFYPSAKPGGRFDFMGEIHAPLTCLEGGVYFCFDIQNPAKWQKNQRTGPELPVCRRPEELVAEGAGEAVHFCGTARRLMAAMSDKGSGAETSGKLQKARKKSKAPAGGGKNNMAKKPRKPRKPDKGKGSEPA